MPTPEWMNPESPAFNRNWENTPMLPEVVLVRMQSGDIHPTTNGIHLARWLSTGATLVEPEVEAPTEPAVETEAQAEEET